MQRFTLPLILGTAFCLLAGGSVPRAHAQGKSEKVRFETVDQVELEGTFWPGSKGRKSPTVLLLHKLGSDRNKDNWVGLARKLHAEGCAVLSFDFRGHGGSKSIGAKFWTYPYNTRPLLRIKIKGGRLPNTISHTAFNPRYIPYLVNDIEAARLFLERRNDTSECNASNLIVIGAEEGATLGALWVASESYRYRLLPAGVGGVPRLSTKPEGKDIVACVWLSMSRTLGRGNNVSSAIRDWLVRAGRNQKIPMAFVYGKKDKTGSANALYFVRTIKPGYDRGKKPRPGIKRELPSTGDWGVPDTKLAGAELLHKSLKKTINWISTTYLKDSIFEKVAPNEWEKRETEKAPFVWSFGTTTIPAKNIQDKHTQPLPLSRFSLR